jgi:hypothetical protein
MKKTRGHSVWSVVVACFPARRPRDDGRDTYGMGSNCPIHIIAAATLEGLVRRGGDPKNDHVWGECLGDPSSGAHGPKNVEAPSMAFMNAAILEKVFKGTMRRIDQE